MRYWPAASVTAVREKPVEFCVAVTFTSGAGAEDWSVTTPSRLAEATCAAAGWVAANIVNNTKGMITARRFTTTLMRFILSSGLGIPLLILGVHKGQGLV